jgi:hypothetical protein
MTADENEIVVYQPDETVRLIMRLTNKAVFMLIVQQLRAEVD